MRRSRLSAKPAMVALGLLLAGCGGGGGGGGATGEAPLAAGDYQLVFALGGTGDPGGPRVNGVDLTVTLPAGVRVAVADGSGRIPASALAPGTGIQGTRMIVGQYSDTRHQAHLTLAAAPGAAWSGDFAVLSITLPAGSSIPRSMLLGSLADGVAGCTVVAIDPATHDTVALTGAVSASVRLVQL